MPRKVTAPPGIKGFKPFGGAAAGQNTEAVTLLLEEYEALRLCDYDQYNHEEAASLMGVSRPTFTRIYAAALKKIAQAFVAGISIIIEGGHVYFDSEWYYCKVCECRFNHPGEADPPSGCPLCGATATTAIPQESSGSGMLPSSGKIIFRCEHCGLEEGIPASEVEGVVHCPACHASMSLKMNQGCGMNDCL
jgi:predicted DNA-binding protein (UPF0251 family)